MIVELICKFRERKLQRHRLVIGHREFSWTLPLNGIELTVRGRVQRICLCQVSFEETAEWLEWPSRRGSDCGRRSIANSDGFEERGNRNSRFHRRLRPTALAGPFHRHVGDARRR